MKKLIVFGMMLLLCCGLVSAGWFDSIVDYYTDLFGSDDVVQINNYQLAYFYESPIVINETNMTRYRCMILEFNENPWRFSISVGSEVIV